MDFRPLGSTGLRVSVVSFGAGPVPALMTDGARAPLQVETVRRALERGVNWFDTAASYGDGASERALGAALRELGASRVHVATKVRLMPDRLSGIAETVRTSLLASLDRLQRDHVSLLQLHNSITPNRGDQHTSITPADVLGPGGVLEAFRHLRSQGLVRHFGLTGLGDPDALKHVIRCGEFETIQLACNIIGAERGSNLSDPLTTGELADDFLRVCAERKMGVFAIRVFAGGALAGLPPSAHTLKTKFFPLSLYQRDLDRACALAKKLPAPMSLKEAAVRFVLSRPAVSSALIGFAAPDQVDEAVVFAERGPLPESLLRLAVAGG